jgi:hypothetical protein
MIGIMIGSKSFYYNIDEKGKEYRFKEDYKSLDLSTIH